MTIETTAVLLSGTICMTYAAVNECLERPIGFVQDLCILMPVWVVTGGGLMRGAWHLGVQAVC